MPVDLKEKTVRHRLVTVNSIVGGVVLGFVLSLAILASTPSLAETANLNQRSVKLKSKSADLNRRLSALSKEISRQRYGELEETRNEIREKLDAWMRTA